MTTMPSKTIKPKTPQKKESALDQRSADTLITKDMTIGEVVKRVPTAADIMLSYGLSCVGCSVNYFESIEMGAKGHGRMSDEQVAKLVQQLNDAAVKFEHEMVENGIAVSPGAVEKIKEISEKQDKKGYGLNIKVIAGGCAGYQYQLTFKEKAGETDQEFTFDGVKVFVSDESYEMLRGSYVDYVEGLEASGFKVDNPNATQACGCGKSFG